MHYPDGWSSQSISCGTIGAEMRSTAGALGKENVADQGRWWEHYYVRYFVGTAFAVPLLLMIGQQDPWKSACAAVSGQGWLTAGAVGIGGLAFCYVASAPVLLLHAMRAKIPRTSASYVAVVFAIIACSVVALFALCHTGEVEFQKGSPLLLVPYACVIVAQLVTLLLGATANTTRAAGVKGTAQSVPADAPQAKNVEAIVGFYVGLATKRAEAVRGVGGISPRTEFIESYRHLREHGNAILILIAEAVFALALLHSSTFAAAILVTILWVLPASIVWPLASWLEVSLDSVE
jgi:hypothetical protein